MEPYSHRVQPNPWKPLMTWGARINLEEPQHRHWPSWVTRKWDQRRWSRRGLTIWNPDEERFVQLNASFALALFEDMQTDTAWREQGITIGEVEFSWGSGEFPSAPDAYPLPATVSRSPYPPPLPSGSSPRLVNPMPLTPEQARIVYDLLIEHEAKLHEIAEDDIRVALASIVGAWSNITLPGLKKEAQAIDLTAREFPWSYDPETNIFVCEQPRHRGTVYLAKDPPTWRVRLEVRGLPPLDNDRFGKLEQALAWVEQFLRGGAEVDAELAALPPEPPDLSLATLTEEHRERLRPFWIEPQVLEPTRLTYRAAIRLRHAYLRAREVPLSFGETYPFDKEYPMAQDIEQRFHLDLNQVKILDLQLGLFWVHATTTYLKPTGASEQAVRLWERSTLASGRWSGKVLWAYFGVEEVETGYVDVIGGVGDWPPQTDRAAFLAERAFKLTLVHAADLADYRSALGIPDDMLDDETMLRKLHKERANSTVIPEPARAESRQWLKEYDEKTQAAKRKRR